MEFGSLCAMGGMTPYPVRSALKYFPQDFSLRDSLLQDAAGASLQGSLLQDSLLQDAAGSLSRDAAGAAQGEN